MPPEKPILEINTDLVREQQLRIGQILEAAGYEFATRESGLAMLVNGIHLLIAMGIKGPALVGIVIDIARAAAAEQAGEPPKRLLGADGRPLV